MYNFESGRLNLILSVLILLMAITQVSGQTASEIIVGTTTVKPTIDGQWQQGEWDNATEYELTQGPSESVKIPSYFRMMHDASNLYGIIDVPSDNGAQYINANGDLMAGGAFLAFYYGVSLSPNTQLFTLFEFSVNQTTKRANVTVISSQSQLNSSQSQVATGLSTTIHSSSLHRIWEFSISIHPYVIGASLDTNPTMGFELTVIDSSGTQLSLNQHATITFVGTSVPEIISGQITLPLALLMPLIVLFAYYKRKLGNHS